MVQIKVTPEMLEEVAKQAYSTKHALESIHKNLCNQIDHLCYQWIGASNQHFVQMFNDAKPKAFTSINAIANVEEELKQIAEKFRTADTSYDGNLVDGNISDDNLEEGAMCGKLPPKSDLERAWDGLKKDLGDAWDGLYDGSGQAIGDAWEGLKALGDGETWSNMWDAVVNIDETLPAMWNAFSDSFMNEVWHGDVESGFRWGSYLLTSIGTGLLGGKGLDKVSKLARGVNVYKVTEAFPPRLQPAFAGGGLTADSILSTLPPSRHWGSYLSGYLMFDAYGGYYRRKEQRGEEYQNNITNPMTKAELPNKGHFRFIPGKEVRFNKQLNGYVDKFDNVWTKGPYHGDPKKNFEFEWDVQLSEKGMKEWGKYTKNGKKYINVAPDGTISH